MATGEQPVIGLDAVLLDLAKGQAASGASLAALLTRVEGIDRAVNDARERQERSDDNLESRIAKLEHWQAKLIGLAAGIGLGSGALSAVITQALSNGR